MDTFVLVHLSEGLGNDPTARILKLNPITAFYGDMRGLGNDPTARILKPTRA